MLMDIWVKDTHSGKIHQVGTDNHDSLELIDDKVEYVNLQSNGGTYGGDFIFVEAPSRKDDTYIDVTPDALRMNRALMHKDLLKAFGCDEDAIIIS